MQNLNEERSVAEGHEQRQADISTNTYVHTFNANGGRFILYWSGCKIRTLHGAGMHPGIGDLVLGRPLCGWFVCVLYHKSKASK